MGVGSGPDTATAVARAFTLHVDMVCNAATLQALIYLRSHCWVSMHQRLRRAGLFAVKQPVLVPTSTQPWGLVHNHSSSCLVINSGTVRISPAGL
jgi:hypothetical protein